MASELDYLICDWLSDESEDGPITDFKNLVAFTKSKSEFKEDVTFIKTGIKKALLDLCDDVDTVKPKDTYGRYNDKNLPILIRAAKQLSWDMPDVLASLTPEEARKLFDKMLSGNGNDWQIRRVYNTLQRHAKREVINGARMGVADAVSYYSNPAKGVMDLMDIFRTSSTALIKIPPEIRLAPLAFTEATRDLKRPWLNDAAIVKLLMGMEDLGQAHLDNAIMALAEKGIQVAYIAKKHTNGHSPAVVFFPKEGAAYMGAPAPITERGGFFKFEAVANRVVNNNQHARYLRNFILPRLIEAVGKSQKMFGDTSHQSLTDAAATLKEKIAGIEGRIGKTAKLFLQ